MCSLCGMLGQESHWTDAAGRSGLGGPVAPRRRQERLARVALANRILAHYRLGLADFEGRAYVLRSMTGRHEVVPDLMAVWAAAGRLAGRPCDPLEPGLIAALERE